jgi:hypothetical protein
MRVRARRVRESVKNLLSPMYFIDYSAIGATETRLASSALMSLQY